EPLLGVWVGREGVGAGEAHGEGYGRSVDAGGSGTGSRHPAANGGGRTRSGRRPGGRGRGRGGCEGSVDAEERARLAPLGAAEGLLVALLQRVGEGALVGRDGDAAEPLGEVVGVHEEEDRARARALDADAAERRL